MLIYENEDRWRESFYQEGQPQKYAEQAVERVAHLAARPVAKCDAPQFENGPLERSV
ncbi:MAG: hypothetical protein RI565_04910 [Schleiferiaceae bacterium]|nr:hypothetical protein [Schleiferiaceae bacterium]